jgi:hypothetical protein
VKPAKVTTLAVRHGRRVYLEVADLRVVLLDREARDLVRALLGLVDPPAKLVGLVEIRSIDPSSEARGWPSICSALKPKRSRKRRL